MTSPDPTLIIGKSTNPINFLPADPTSTDDKKGSPCPNSPAATGITFPATPTGRSATSPRKKVFPEELSGSHRVSSEAWWADEPYKIVYPEYVHNLVTREHLDLLRQEHDRQVEAVRRAGSRVEVGHFAHYGEIAMPSTSASIGEARMGRFGRSAAWRNTATFGTSTRSGTVRSSVLPVRPDREGAPRRLALPSFHTDNWIVIAIRAALRRHVRRQRRGLDRAAAHLHPRDRVHQPAIPRDGGRRHRRGRPRVRRAHLQHPDRRGPTCPAGRADDQGAHRQRAQGVGPVPHRPHVLALVAGLRPAHRVVDGINWHPAGSWTMSFREFIEDWVVKQFADQFRDSGSTIPGTGRSSPTSSPGTTTRSTSACGTTARRSGGTSTPV